MSLKRKTPTLCARLSHGMGPIVSAAALAAILASSTQAQNEDTLGRWEQPLGGYDWPLIAMHAVHLSTGKILVWKDPDSPDPQLWDPATGGFTAVPPAQGDNLNVNCSGHVALANGSILLAGGAGSNNEAWIFSLDDLWQPAASMQYGRFYPTCTTVPSGDVLVISGRAGGQPVLVPEIYDPKLNAWEALPTQVIEFKTYPFMFVLPDAGTGSGTVFYAGGGMAGGNPGLNTYTLDLGTQTWSAPIPSNFLGRRGSAVMYEPGKVLKSGGFDGSDIINYTDVIDFTDPSPQWELDLLGMVHARRWHTLVVVADGKILAVGGEEGDPADPTTVLAAEWFDPNDPFLPQWRPLAEMTFKRGNHSTAMLLADATVLVAGGDDNDPNPATAEIFKPPYLFKAGGGDADRPVIGFAPTAVSYGTHFSVILSRGSPVPREGIEKVTFVRLGAVTHSFNMDQRYLSLAVQTDPSQEDGLIVEAPVDGNDAPPGYYMLFLISDDGVPCLKAKYVRLYEAPSP